MVLFYLNTLFISFSYNEKFISTFILTTLLSVSIEENKERTRIKLLEAISKADNKILEAAIADFENIRKQEQRKPEEIELLNKAKAALGLFLLMVIQANFLIIYILKY